MKKDQVPIPPQPALATVSQLRCSKLLSTSPQITADGSVNEFLEAGQDLVGALASFMDDVLVLTEDTAQRANRLALLRRVAALPSHLIDPTGLDGLLDLCQA